MSRFTLRLAVALALCLLAVSVSPTDAAILFLKGSDEALHVRTIRENETAIVVGIPQADGSYTERLIERRNIDQFIPTVAKDRLTALDPAKPAIYRDYAEELAEKKIDPDARDAAIRLYLIAAHLDAKRLARSSLLGVIPLARSAREERSFRAMAFLLDPKHDRSVLKEDSVTASDTADEHEGREQLLGALRLLRQGNHRTAERFVTRPGASAALARHGGSFSRADFLAACATGESLDESTLAKVIRLELKLSGAKVAAPTDGEPAGPDWTAALESGDTSPVSPLNLRSLTEFDPELCLFREGKWVGRP